MSYLTVLTDYRLLRDDVRPLWGRRLAGGGGVEPQSAGLRPAVTDVSPPWGVGKNH